MIPFLQRSGLLLLLAGLPTDSVAEPLEFARDIQPIFANKCILCHGPDDAEGGLQLHLREKAFANLESGACAIVPGKPEASELFSRITSDDPDLRMPPEGLLRRSFPRIA